MSSTSSLVSSEAWSLDGTVATSSHATASAILDLAHPHHGLELTSGLRAGDRLLGVDVDGLTDHWLRGPDLAAVYEPRDARELRSTVMWRRLESNQEVAAWETIVSAQTDRLASGIDLAVRSTLAADAVRWLAPAGDVWHDSNNGIPAEAVALLVSHHGKPSVLVAVHPADARRVEAQATDGRWNVACWLFAASLERGVLLRSRVLAALGPADDETWALRLMEAFAASPPPLAT